MVKKGTAPRKATAVPSRGGGGGAVDRRSRRAQPTVVRVHSASDDEDDGVWQALFHGPAHEAGAFYNQIHDEIKMLRSRVDQKLKDMIVGGQEDVDALNRQLHSLRSQASSDSEQELVPFAVEAGAGIFSDDIRKLHDTMRIEEEMSKKRIESAKAEERSYDDLRVSSSTATEPATNLTRATVARRLEKVNFPESGTILEQEHESSSSSSSNDDSDERHRQTMARRQRKQVQRKGNRTAPMSPKDAVTAARTITTEDAVTNARFGIESPPRRRFFPDGSTFPPEHVYEEYSYPELEPADSMFEQGEEEPNPHSSTGRVRQGFGTDMYGESQDSLDEPPSNPLLTHDPPLNRTASEVHRSIAHQPANRPPKQFFPPSPSKEPPATHVGESTRSRVVPDPDAVTGASPRKEKEKAIASKAKREGDAGVSMRELNEGNLDLLVASLEYLDSNLKNSMSSDQLAQKKEHAKNRPAVTSRRSNENELDRMMASLEYLDDEDQGSSTHRPPVADDQLRPLALNNHKALTSASASNRSESHALVPRHNERGNSNTSKHYDGNSPGRSRRSNESPAIASRQQHSTRNIRGRDQPDYTTSASETSRSSAVSYRYEYDYNGRRVQRSHDRQYYQLHDEAEEPKDASEVAASQQFLKHPQHQPPRASVAGGESRRSQAPSAVSHPRGNPAAAAASGAGAPQAVPAVVDWPDGHSHASDHSYASRSIAHKSASLHSIAQSSVTDSMDLEDTGKGGGTGPSPGRDLLAELEEEVGAGVCVKIEKVQNFELTDPYGDKGRYTGLLVKEKPYGHGSMHYDDGRSYTGEWKSGRWHGKGRTLFVNGDFFVGEYVKDQRHGRGRYEWSDGRVYDGHFKRDRRDGKGTYTWPDGAIYTGDFKAGQRHGQGCYKFKDGSVYTGEFREGLYHGVGECVWSDGRCYRGEWSRGHANGYGIEIRPDGSIRHDGEWKNDRPVRLREPQEVEKVEKKRSMFPEGDRDPRQRRNYANHALPAVSHTVHKGRNASAPGSHYSSLHRPIVVSNLDP